MTLRNLAATGILAAAMISASAGAATFTGTFNKDNSKAAFIFKTDGTTPVSITTSGYAGGGFDPVLSLYDANGDAVDYNDDGPGLGSDAQLTGIWAAGKYKVYVTQYDNFGPASLGLPFNFDGQPHFAGDFKDFFGNQRTGDYSVSIEGAVLSAAVPESSTWAMLIAGFGMIGGTLRRRGTRVALA